MLDEQHVELKDIFIFKPAGLDSQGKAQGAFEPTGFIPAFIEDIRARGIKLADEIL